MPTIKDFDRISEVIKEAAESAGYGDEVIVTAPLEVNHVVLRKLELLFAAAKTCDMLCQELYLDLGGSPETLVSDLEGGEGGNGMRAIIASYGVMSYNVSQTVMISGDKTDG